MKKSLTFVFILLFGCLMLTQMQAKDASEIPHTHFCPDDNHPHIVDLGLPSGKKWSCCNVGALIPSEPGSTFVWAATDTITQKSKYNKDNVTDSNDRLVDIGGNPSEDAATALWGRNWHLPSKADCDELIEQCEWMFAQLDDKWGWYVAGPNGNTIFIPTIEAMWPFSENGGKIIGEKPTHIGFYWTSSGYHYRHVDSAEKRRMRRQLAASSGGYTLSLGEEAYNISAVDFNAELCVRPVTTEGTKDNQDIDNTHDIENIEDSEDIKGTKDDEVAEDTADIEKTENTEEPNKTEDSEDPENPEDPEETEETKVGTAYVSFSPAGGVFTTDTQTVSVALSKTANSGWYKVGHRSRVSLKPGERDQFTIGADMDIDETVTVRWGAYSTGGTKYGSVSYKKVDPNIYITADPANETKFTTEISVTLSVKNADAVYYTLDGSPASASSTLYTGAITLTKTTTINAFASNDFGSKTASFTYTKDTSDFVDLGLSVKWARCNVGAKQPEDFGGYFSWGEITPQTEFPKDGCSTSGLVLGDISGNPQYDAARAENSKGRMPTEAEFLELIEKCQWDTETINGVKGQRVTGPNGNSIFIPITGWYDNRPNIVDKGVYGRYWTATSINSFCDDPNQAVHFYIGTWERGTFMHLRYCGYAIRAVADK